MPLSPKALVNSAVVKEVAKIFTKLLPSSTDPINPSVSSVIYSALEATLDPLSACLRSFPREAAVNAVSLPENIAERSNRNKTAPIVIQKL